MIALDWLKTEFASLLDWVPPLSSFCPTRYLAHSWTHMFAELNPWATKGREKLPKDRQNRKAAVPNRSVRTVQNKQNHQLQIPQFQAKNTYDTCSCDWCQMGWAQLTSTCWVQIRFFFFLFTLRLSLSVRRINMPYSLGVQISAWLLRKK